MRRTQFGFVALVPLVAGCPGGFFPPDGVVTFSTNFTSGEQGWAADVSDYSVPEADIIDFDAGIEDLPAEIGSGRGYFVTSSNRSDDLFVFLKRKIGEADGLLPNQAYTLQFTIRIASNAPTGCFGVGGAPGEGLYVKVGGATIEPEPLSPDENEYIALSVDKGVQSQNGPAATVIGDIANGDECDDPTNAPYVSIVRTGAHIEPVTTDADGNLWLLVGTDSAYEGITTMYYQRILVTLTPISE